MTASRGIRRAWTGREKWAWAVEWHEVRGQMIRYLIDRRGPALLAA